MPYIGTKGEQLLRNFKKKLLRCLNVNVQINTRIATTKLNLLANTKDKVPKQNKSNVVYEFTCPKCNSSYVGKTDRTLVERVKEHAYKDQECAVNKHLNSYYDTNYLDSKTNNELTDFVMTNLKIIDSSNNWNLLLYKEALHIKNFKRRCCLIKGRTIRYPGRGVSDPKKKFMQEIELEKKFLHALEERKKIRATS